MGTEQNNWLWKVREEKTLLFSLNDHFEKDSELQKFKVTHYKKWLQMCCDWTAVETQSKLGLSSWILFILIYHLPSFLGVPFSFHRVQPTFFFCHLGHVVCLVPFSAMLCLSPSVSPFCHYFPASLQPLPLFDPSSFLLLFLLSLWQATHTSSNMQEGERKGERNRGESEVYKYKKAKQSCNTWWARHRFYITGPAKQIVLDV